MRAIRTFSLLFLGSAVEAHRPRDPSLLLAATRVRGGADDAGAAASSGSPSVPSGGLPGMEEMMASAGIDMDKMDEIMKSLPGGEEGLPSVEESMEMMNNMVNSPQFDQYMNDPEQLEKSRQMILNNPMMKSMMDSMPGMDEILNDEEKWKESMQAAAEMYKSMGSNLMDMMGGGNTGLGGVGGDAGAAAGLAGDTLGGALDELSEGED